MKKKFKPILVMVVTITVLILACAKHGGEKQFKEQSMLNEDETFITMVNETHDFLEFLASTIKANSLSKNEVDSKFSEMQSKNLTLEGQMKEIDLIFKAKVSSKLKSQIIATQKSFQEIKINYGKIEAATLNREVEKVMMKMVKKVENSNIRSLAAVDCGWRYYGCSAAATAGAILCHGACEGTAIATTAGLGIFACVAACGTLQAWAIVECADRFCISK